MSSLSGWGWIRVVWGRGAAPIGRPISSLMPGESHTTVPLDLLTSFAYPSTRRYYPLTSQIGTWPLQAGDTLVCELWECDGGKGGCSPSNPSVPPNSEAGDDHLGSLDLNMSSYKSDMIITTNFEDSSGTVTGTIMLECDACWQIYRDNASWTNPYKPGDMPDYLMINPPSPPPPPPILLSPTAAPSPTAVPSPPAIAPVSVAAPSPAVAHSPAKEPSPSPSRVPVITPLPSPPPAPPVAAYDGPEETPSPPETPPASPGQENSRSSSGLSTGAIAGIAAVVAVAALAGITWIIYCFRRGKGCFAGSSVHKYVADHSKQKNSWVTVYATNCFVIITVLTFGSHFHAAVKERHRKQSRKHPPAVPISISPCSSHPMPCP